MNWWDWEVSDLDPLPVFAGGYSLSAVQSIVSDAFHSAREQIARSGDLEVVGIVWSDSTISPLINQARSATRFSVSESLFAETIAAVNPAEKTMVSLYHSHPGDNPRPSKLDSDMIVTQFNDRNLLIPWTIITHSRPLWGLWWANSLKKIQGVIRLQPFVSESNPERYANVSASN